jgi:hypothetical protein
VANQLSGALPIHPRTHATVESRRAGPWYPCGGCNQWFSQKRFNSLGRPIHWPGRSRRKWLLPIQSGTDHAHVSLQPSHTSPPSFLHLTPHDAVSYISKFLRQVTLHVNIFVRRSMRYLVNASFLVFFPDLPEKH